MKRGFSQFAETLSGRRVPGTHHDEGNRPKRTTAYRKSFSTTYKTYKPVKLSAASAAER
jgi:hypothetical protein